MSDEVAERLDRLRTAALTAQRAERDAMLQQSLEGARQSHENYEFVVAQCRPARPWEYPAWLRGWMAAGNNPTHYYDYLSPKMWVAMSHLVTLRPMYGSAAIYLLIPEGTNYEGNPGHTTLFITKDGSFTTRQHASVPVWSDTEVLPWT